MIGDSFDRDIPHPTRSIEEILRQLADLATVRAAAELYGTPDFASELALKSIIKHQDELLTELEGARNAGADIESGLVR